MPLDRQVLLGIGIGLLLGATLTAVGGGHQRSLSRMEIVSRAKALGMTFQGEERLNFAGPASAPQTAASATPSAPRPVAPSVPPAADTASVVASPSVAGAAKAKPTYPVPGKPKKVAAKVAAAPVATTLTVVVPPGATAGEVARLLRSKSLIADEDEFLHMAQVRQAESRFLPGTYRFKSDVTVKSLISSLLSGSRAQ